MNAFLSVLFISTSFFFNSLFSQKQIPFQGKMVYQVDFSDSLSERAVQTSYVTLYTNDTLVRIESETPQLGQQVLIKHLILRKYYILLQMNGGKYAIQQNIATDSLPSKYTYQKKFGSKRFDGKKAKKILVSSSFFKKSMEMYYFRDIKPDYLDVMKGIPGLPAEYFVQTDDGLYHYTLIKFSVEKTEKDLYGIPSDYKKLSFDEFMEIMIQAN